MIDSRNSHQSSSGALRVLDMEGGSSNECVAYSNCVVRTPSGDRISNSEADMELITCVVCNKQWHRICFIGYVDDTDSFQCCSGL